MNVWADGMLSETGGEHGADAEDEGQLQDDEKQAVAREDTRCSGRAGCRSIAEVESGAGVPLISVIVPVYNSEACLERCLDGILAQSVRNLEIICVNDGSTDASPAMLERYASGDARLRVIHQKHLGVSAARNTGLAVAVGRWISFVDSDDQVLPGMYEALLKDCCGEDAVCFGAEEFAVFDGRLKQVKSGYFDVKFSGFRILEDDDLLRLSMVVWDKLFLRERVERMHLRFPEGMNFEDNAFVFSFFVVNRRARFMSDRFYRYFRRAESITGQARAGKIGLAFDYIRLLDPVHSLWMRLGLLPKRQSLFEKFCVYCFRSAADSCLTWERPGIAYELASFLHRGKFSPRDSLLRALKSGDMSIRLGRFPGRDMAMLRPLRGLEKLFFIGNCRESRVVCLFSFRVASWKRPVRD